MLSKPSVTLPSLMRMRRCLVRGHLDRRIVVGGADDEIRLGHDAPLIGPVVMRESPTRRFDDANSFGWGLESAWHAHSER